tara:strand:+ start:134 stop:520 length:387 start_codon:yes stop_codon:yes gene_type:complete
MLSDTLKSVLQPQTKKYMREKELKDKMVKVVLEKIKIYASCGQTSCKFTVPLFLFGYIPYKYESMIKYLKSKFYKEGFYIKDEVVGVLYISWSIADINNVKDSKRKEKLKEINAKPDLSAFASTYKLK